jgi:hypothetical protein
MQSVFLFYFIVRSADGFFDLEVAGCVLFFISRLVGVENMMYYAKFLNE